MAYLALREAIQAAIAALQTLKRGLPLPAACALHSQLEWLSKCTFNTLQYTSTFTGLESSHELKFHQASLVTLQGEMTDFICQAPGLN